MIAQTEACKKHAKLLAQAAARARRLTFVSGFRMRADPCARCGGYRLVIDRPPAPAPKESTP